MNKFSEQELRARIGAELRMTFSKQINVDRASAARGLGVTRGHLANCELARKPLLPTVRIGWKPLIQIPDLIDFLVAQHLRAQTKRGAPTKVEWSARGKSK